MKFSLFTAAKRGVAKNTSYPTKVVVDSENTLRKAVQFDFVGAEYKDNKRSIENFISSDVVIVDIDNDHSEDPRDWKDVDDIKKAFPNVGFAIQRSRNHLKVKDGKPARPKSHVLFPVNKITTKKDYDLIKKQIYIQFPFIDTNAMDTARFFYGTDAPEVVWVEGPLTVDAFFEEEDFEKNIGKTKEGGRNCELSRQAAIIVKAIGFCDEAVEAIYRYNEEHMVPPLEKEEIDATIIPSVKKFWTNKVLADPNYVKPDEYASQNWEKKLKYGKNGIIANTLQNLLLILRNDKYLQNIVFNQLADGMEIIGEVPWNHPSRFWRDADDAQIICYIDETYGHFSKETYLTAITKVADDRSYHPIKQYFESLPEWDGVNRVDTLLIDYFGAADNNYVRAVIRKTLCAAYMRVYKPALKFDSVLCLNTKQGTGKSTLIAKLGMDWFNDSLSVSDMNDKTAAEKLQGYWILEIGELAGMKKADVDKVKAFISRQDDKYRASFGRRVTSHPRQCIFFATTNSENGFLRDVTGNRRFWVVKATGEGSKKAWDLTQTEVDQIWAEVKVLASKDEPLFLSYELEELAQSEQNEAMEQDEREGLVIEYLNKKLPTDWDVMTLEERLAFLRGDEYIGKTRVGTVTRTMVSNMEIWVECFGNKKEDLKPTDSYAIKAIMTRLKGWNKSDNLEQLPIYGRQRVYVKVEK